MCPRSGLEKPVNVLQLSSLRKVIPPETFEKSLLKSLYYMIFDYAMWFGSVLAIWALCSSFIWTTMPFWQKAIASVVFWNLSGFFMWCIFVVGHDCGHSNFSNYQLLNDILGHIMHGSLFVPFYPWQASHTRHHMFHNHVTKDYSHPWYTPERLASPESSLARLMHAEPLVTVTFPIYGWHLYLFGMPDGCHYYPFTSQRLWVDASGLDRVKCIISSSVCLLYLAGFYLMSGSISTLVYYYLVPYLVFGWWLVTVTYLQHHSPSTTVYNDPEWKFVDAAFETVDRKYGFGIDTLSHHITDGHVAHHLFFTKIPHYNLPIATKAIREYMVTNNLQEMYRYEDTFDFAYRVHKYFVAFGFKATIADDRPTSGSVEAKKVK